MERLRGSFFKVLRADQEIVEGSTFGLLPQQRNRRRSFAISAIANIMGMVLFLVLSLAHLPRVKPAPMEATALTFETTTLRLPHIRIVAPSSKSIARVTQEQKIPAPPSSLAGIRRVKVGTFSNVRPAAAQTTQRTSTIRVGAFGNPAGARTNPYARLASLRAPVLGTFGGVPGAMGSGTGLPRRNGGGVRLARFGTGAGGGSGSAPSQAETQPVTVTHSVKPVYTSEAHSAGVQGEVILRVRFAANGRVEILSVLQPLGHGLVESAENAVRQYRFLPALRNGRPVDQTTTVHVRFQLAA